MTSSSASPPPPSVTTPADDRAYPARPIIGVGVVVWRGDDVLLIQRGKAPRRGTWSLPGGAQELGERAAETAVREVMEETGVEIALGRLVDVVDSIRLDTEGRVASQYLLVDFVAEWVAGEPVAGDDAMDARFVPFARLVDYGLWEETQRVIEISRALR